MQKVHVKQKNSKIISNEIIDIIIGIKKSKKCLNVILDLEIIDCRNDIVDWLLTVCKNMKLKDSTYFIAVETLDLFLEESKNEKALNQNEYLVIGVVCLLLSTKLNEIEFLELDMVINKLCNNYVTKVDLINVEKNILYTINFRVRNTLFEDLVYLVLFLFDEEARSQLNGKLTKTYQKIFDFNIFIMKLVYQKYDFYRVKDKITLYFAILNLSLQNKLRVKHPIKFDHYEQFYKLAETFNIKVKKIEKYTEGIYEEYLKFIKNPSKNENYLYIEEYTSMVV